ncbi:hypothetical protein Btru_032953 [Bulinus truncatus]|nr:hypothetical protein Btru_032953 [Bulinus truncatus]
MSRLGELRNSYLNSLKSLTRSTNRVKTSDKHEDDMSWKNNSPISPNPPSKPQFPLTPNMLLLSACFWLFMFTLIYESIIYGTMYSRITMEADLNRECHEKFGSEDENLKKIDNYSIGDAGPYIFRLRPMPQTEYPIESVSLPPIVTAVSSLEFYQLQGLVNHIMEDLISTYQDLKFIVYDIGLYSKERELVERYCHCEVRDFSFEEYPSHVADISNFAWRPIILQKVLEEFGSAVYVETTTRFKTTAAFLALKL